MTNWNDFTAAAPDLAAAVQGRFEAHLHHVVATLRRDGSPRVSGTEARFFAGELYLGCMPNSRKGADLRRDPRLALHAATVDVELQLGDAKVAGTARLCERDEALAFLRSLAGPDAPPDADPPVDGDVFAVALTGATLTRVEGDELVVQTWAPGTEVRTIRRT